MHLGSLQSSEHTQQQRRLLRHKRSSSLPNSSRLILYTFPEHEALHIHTHQLKVIMLFSLSQNKHAHTHAYPSRTEPHQQISRIKSLFLPFLLSG